MTEENYVSLEVAELLKDKGFNEDCNRAYYIEDPDIAPLFYGSFSNYGELYISGYIAAPTLYEAQKWLRENHKIYVLSLPTKVCGKTIWYYQIAKDIFDDAIYGHVSDDDCKNYEEALNAGILEALKLI